MTRLPPILVVTVIGAIAAFCVLRVQFSANLYEMLPADLPEVRGMDQLNQYFSRDGQLIVTLKANEAFIADEALASLTERLEEQPGLVSQVYRELSLTELVTEGGGLLAWLWLNAPPEEFAALAERLAPEKSQARIATSMETLQSSFFDQAAVITSYDPLGLSDVGELIGGDGESSGPDPMASEDGTFQLIYVEGNGVDFSSYRDAAVWLEKVRAIVDAWEQEWEAAHEGDPGITVGLTGTPAFMAEVGSEMERDMTISVVMTMLLISLLFWIMHRQTKPLSWLVSAMLAILAITLFIGGLFFGNLSVMSAGFAAILMGLAVDYGIVIYRESIETQGDARALRKAVGPSILWAAGTTAVVFLSLNLSSLPGISEMGNLVAMGVMIGALIMLYGFAPIAVSFTKSRKGGGEASAPKPRMLPRPLFLAVSFGIPVLALASMFLKEIPHLETNFHPFRIRESPSMISWQTLQSELKGRENAVPTVITAPSIGELQEELGLAEKRIEAATSSGLLIDSVLPTAFIPDPVRQEANRETALRLLEERERLESEIGKAGFSEEGVELTSTLFEAWKNYADQLETREFAAPTGALAEWSLERLFAEQEGTFAALGTVKPSQPRDRNWVHEVCNDSTAVASLGSLGTALNERIKEDVLRVFLPMMGILAAMLALVFRSWRDLLLSLSSLGFAAAGMVLLTVWTPMTWNSFNVCGLPLLFGTGLDFSIHMIFALRRGKGDIARARRGIGKALIFCGASSAIGFGSLATASAHGLASLGIVCATGILINMLIAVFLVPSWYRAFHGLDAKAKIS